MNNRDKLKELIKRFSYQDGKQADLLEDIDRIVSITLEQEIKIGDSLRRVEELLGPPFTIIGEEEDEQMYWLYPASPLENKPDQFPEEWFYVLSFYNKQLRKVEKRTYRLH
ncbi:hypothetical protein C900_01834 [Fulvivirga imtechensis AK7]|uniref:Uncharacterized protein n=1 Tax=Fulvivirga imtechensis AK7 TaxID=1237149 RepID=L8JY01_9BACT|nr:hypothetical protein C900_01834 [Fulvivirga imtechensis AK7]